MDLRKFGKRAYNCALRRGKIHEGLEQGVLHQETIEGLNEEVHEVIEASETEISEHLDNYPAVVEELADVALVAITELYRRGVDIDAVLHEKRNTMSEDRVTLEIPHFEKGEQLKDCIMKISNNILKRRVKLVETYLLEFCEVNGVQESELKKSFGCGKLCAGQFHTGYQFG